MNDEVSELIRRISKLAHGTSATGWDSMKIEILKVKYMSVVHWS